MLSTSFRGRVGHEIKTTQQDGVALLEALIAILIFSLGILGLIGLQANATRIATAAKFRIDASQLVSQCMGDLWLDSTNLGECQQNAATVLPEGKLTTTIAGREATVTVTWSIPGDDIAYSHTAVAVINAN